ncbi:putative F-box/FBD/LRR-repeat protein-like [Capsicum annuum]|nr:putative F-box/FBD/LRR-repeat protein-like [Capsicum annuum]
MNFVCSSSYGSGVANCVRMSVVFLRNLCVIQCDQCVRSKGANADREYTEDRISVLPINVLDYVVELLPIEDAARTSILSKKWRYIWAMSPNLVLDNLFCNKLAKESCSFFYNTVDNILLQHIGDIVKFDLDVSGLGLPWYTDIDRWMHYVTRHGVKKLNLNVPKNSTYKVPSYIFNCSTLTDLTLSNCVFKSPTSFLGFQNLITLCLKSMTFVPTAEFCVIKVPLLVDLILDCCQGTRYLNIVSPQLESLVVFRSDCLELNCFRNCKKLKRIIFSGTNKVVDVYPKYLESSTLEKFLFSLPTLAILHLESHFLKLLAADNISKELPFALDCLWHLSLHVDFGKLDQTSYALQLIKISPNLTQLRIWVFNTSDNAEAVSEYLDSPACLEQPLNKLRHVTLHLFKGSKTELALVKKLVAHTPSLVRMSIKPNKVMDSWKERNIAIELMRFSRASPRAELLYLPNVV